MSQINLATPTSLGTIDKVEVRGYKVQGLQDVARAYMEVQVVKLTDQAVEMGVQWLRIPNNAPLPKMGGNVVDEEDSQDWATQLFNTISAATGNPKDEIEGWLVTNGVIDGTAA